MAHVRQSIIGEP